MIIYLIGLPGVGKTTTGKMLAKNLHFDYLDLDNEIELSTRKSISTIFKEKGEPYFRELEKDELFNTFNLNDYVISTGGGTPCFFDNIEMMNKNGYTIYLSSTPKDIYDRFTPSELAKRPLLKDGIEKLEDLYSSRKKFYEKSQHKVEITTHNFFEDILSLINLLPNNNK